MEMTKRQPDPLLAVTSAKARSIGDVIDQMRRIDAALPAQDGLKWFNLLYLTVTEQVQAEIAATQWSDRAWLERLDVVFANLYFEAIRHSVSDPGRTPHAWRPLLEARRNARPRRLQFALAGMNAHINRDLCRALIQVSPRTYPKRTSGAYRDYTRVNSVLERAEDRARQFLSTGIIGVADQALGDVDDVLAMWSVRKAREAAWVNAEVLSQLGKIPLLADRYFEKLDRMTGFASRGLLR
jgi:hypothetical protein